ncbi:MAG: PKD domain-containing protein [Anaerolineae bacterium]
MHNASSDVISPTGVSITGPSAGIIGVDYSFTATVSPVSTTVPITYVWHATGQSSPVTNTGDLSDTVAFAWDTAGTKAIAVAGANAGDTVTGTYVISIYTPVQTAFSATPLAGQLPLTVAFTDTSTGSVTSWLWSVGDGITHTTQHPTHTYTLTGTFTVSLTASGPGGSDTVVKTHYIRVGDKPIVAHFSAYPTSGPDPLTVQFTDESAGTVTAWQWDFGDGVTDTQPSSIHVYTRTGTHTVSLTVSGPDGTDEETRTDYVRVYGRVVASFGATPTVGIAPLGVQFTDLSTGDFDTHSWDFGDGGSSTLQHPVYTYTVGGVYPVTLTVSGLGGTDVITRANYITVYEPVHADFTADLTGGVGPLTVQFTNLSTGDYITSLWHFGDGISTTQHSPSHTYSAMGAYTVTLTVSGPGGVNTKIEVKYIAVREKSHIYLPLILRNYELIRADFTAWPTSGPVPLTVVFTNTSSGAYTASLWHFGDGITSTRTSPTHTYTISGTYTVTLTVRESGTLILPDNTSTLVRPNYIAVAVPPMAPSDLQATPISCGQIQLTWQDNSSDETGFAIYDGNIWVAGVEANTITYTVGGLAPESYHCFRVYAFNDYGLSDWGGDWGCNTTLPGTEEIANGGFEDDSAWEFPVTPYPATYTVAITRTGSRAVRTGIVDPADNVESWSSVQQTVTIPAGVVSSTLRFWLYPITGEPPANLVIPARPLASAIERVTLASDRQYVLVLDENDQWIRTLIWQRANDQQWTSHEFDMGVHAGQTIKLQFGVYNDGIGGVTAMYVDDVSLELCAPTTGTRLDRRR